MPLPPGPPLPAAVQTALYFARPMGFVDACAARYGDVFSINTYAFGKEVCVSHPDAVKQAFTGDPDVFGAGEANGVLEPLVGPRSVLVLDGAEHLRQRRFLLPPFHGERMLAYAETMRDVTERVVATWPRGTPFALHPHMQRITLDIILRTVFGLDEGAHFDELRAGLARVLDRQGTAIGLLGTLPPLRREVFGLSPWAGFLRDRDHARSLVDRQIQRRKAERARGGAARADVLDLLLDARDEEGKPMSDADLRDELITLLVAGHETTATGLCWAFEQVLADARVLGAVQHELGAASGGGALDAAALARMPYVDAVIKESLRLTPVIPAVGRKLSAPMVVGGHALAAGTMLVPIVTLTHRRPDLYPEPEAFRPERFLDKKPDPYAWYPFGGGVRRCIGMAFALYEMRVVLATALSRVRLRKARPAPAKVKLRGFTFTPEGGAEVVVEGRVATRPAAGAERTAAA